jgi:hypothetical protein
LPCAEDRREGDVQEERGFIHTAYFALQGQHMVFDTDDFVIFVCNHGADGHHLVCPVGFCVDHSKIRHIFPSFFHQYKRKYGETQVADPIPFFGKFTDTLYSKLKI